VRSIFTALKEQRQHQDRALVIYSSDSDIIRRFIRGDGKHPKLTHVASMGEYQENWAEGIWAFLRTPDKKFQVAR
jgi:hypothetical protein